MPTLLMQLAGPMQSWGTRSRFDERDSDLEPSKSGVIGLLCAALGIDRNEEERVLELAQCRMGVRIDREGVLRMDYLTAQMGDATSISRRHYLADAVFLVGLEGQTSLLAEALQALKNPVWPLWLGRKSYVPSPGVYLPSGWSEGSLLEALQEHPLLVEPPKLEKSLTRRFVIENAERVGSLRMDEPRSSFVQRKFAARYVESKYLEVKRVLEPVTS